MFTVCQCDVQVPSQDHRLSYPKNEWTHERHLCDFTHGHVLRVYLPLTLEVRVTRQPAQTCGATIQNPEIPILASIRAGFDREAYA